MNRVSIRSHIQPLLLAVAMLISLSVPRAATAAPAASPSAAPAPAASPSAAPEKPAQPAAPTSEKPAPSEDERAESLSSAVNALGTIQSFLEFYFMETGQYPGGLEDMLSQYNQGVKQTEPLVRVPTDPATGRKFVYTPSPDRTKYTLRAPDPGAYGLSSLQVRQVDWGWMASIAAEKRQERMTVQCMRFMQLVVEQVEQYNKANRNRFPDKLDQLIPKYLQRVPACPLCKKTYEYRHTDRGFEIICPDAKAHGLDELRFSSTEGLKKFP